MTEKVIIDLVKDSITRRVSGQLNIQLVKHGIWEIDNIPGKQICLIELTVPSEGIHLNFPTTHNFCEAYLDEMLRAEWENDNFKFTKPIMGKHRPPELLPKIGRLTRILGKWKGRAKQAQQKLW